MIIQRTYKIMDTTVLLSTYIVSLYHIIIGIGLLADGFGTAPSFTTARILLPLWVWAVWPLLAGITSIVSGVFFPRITSLSLAVGGGWGIAFGGSFWASWAYDGGAISGAITYSFLACPIAVTLSIAWWKLGLEARLHNKAENDDR